MNAGDLCAVLCVCCVHQSYSTEIAPAKFPKICMGNFGIKPEVRSIISSGVESRRVFGEPGKGQSVILALSVRDRVRPLVPSVERCTVRGSLLRNQHRAEPGFALHHASVTIGSLFERNREFRAEIGVDPAHIFSQYWKMKGGSSHE